MVGSVVNLDAMIPREDMISPTADFRGSTIEKIGISNLNGDFFSSMLRKPDFQRETAHWSPEKVADLVRAFVSGDLIPAVILWRRGANIFVIDGAHRLSALIAWIKDDYGAGKRSLEYFGGRVPDEQQKIAGRTRELVNEAVGPYIQFAGARMNLQNVASDVQGMLGTLAVNAIVAQWVHEVDEKAAEDSFFKINQAATPVDATERLILRSRTAANAIAARAIARGGAGHKYWASFSSSTQMEIEARAQAIHAALYEPPLGQPVKTLDVSVAGRGYAALPFIYELVNWANDLSDSAKSKDVQPDVDGAATLRYLGAVEDAIGLITGNTMRSLGLHPLAYFYTRGGEFQPAAFIATLAFVKALSERKRLPEFTRIRARLEAFLLKHKEFATLITKRTGSGQRSLGRTVRYLERLVTEFGAGKSESEVLDALGKDPEFGFLVSSMAAPLARDGENPSRRFSRRTKSASFIETALQGVVRCGICRAPLHMNSIQIDHIDAARAGGRTDIRNAQVAHPYCNSAKDILKNVLNVD